VYSQSNSSSAFCQLSVTANLKTLVVHVLRHDSQYVCQCWWCIRATGYHPVTY